MKQLVVILMMMGVFVMSWIGTEGEVLAEQSNLKNENQVLNIAHRGASGYAPENTMAAFDKAVDMKADMFELDVQMSKDGELVVIHDTTVDRTTDGTGNVGDLTYDELQELDAGSFFGEEFAGEKIPTLGEVLDEYRGKSGILIEMKSPSLYPGIEEKIAEELKKRNLDKPNNDKIIVQSFEHDAVQAFHSILPDVPVGVLLSYSADGISNEQLMEFASYAEYVNPNMAMIDTELVERIHEYGMETHPWTVRDQESADYLLESGADGIITDYPDYVDPRN
ncbi:glycerophosphodiester phosphodiesterase family protein [Halobacillus sp. A5]|uniref:glycerophosphodiester phosphodiesterase n=1 Tax=Halobacillus sp. A5 TaxID=2880263 RepID=UPI0020A65E61|nr:glycerophosphodiester phosphodiesterase family protein [Halobacillus sp. A5]MCP3028487.1 glycerophosphodiester phosphodiesterase [Halobacillus sp. A5]